MGLTGTSTLKELSNKVLEAAKDDENILEGLKRFFKYLLKI